MATEASSFNETKEQTIELPVSVKLHLNSAMQRCAAKLKLQHEGYLQEEKKKEKEELYQ